MSDVFISYSRPDFVIASNLADMLRTAGLDVFLDRDVLVAGEDFKASIATEMRRAKVLLLLLSANSKRSTWLQNELVTALEKGDRRQVIPVLLDSEAKENWIWPLVADRLPFYVDSPQDLERLVKEVMMLAGSPKYLRSAYSPIVRTVLRDKLISFLSTLDRSVLVLISLIVLLPILWVGWQLYNTTNPQVNITNFASKENAQPALGDHGKNSADFKVCRLPGHGIELWGSTQQWTADSGWQRDGLSLDAFCAQQRHDRANQFPERNVDLISSAESTKKVGVFGTVYYRFTCLFEDKWDPVYKRAKDDKCP